IIPLQIQKYITQGQSLSEAFRLAVNDFEGSHAIAMHSDLAPGKLFLAQRGSGQAIFVGLANEHYLPTSEVYGFVEETQQFLRLDGEKIINGKTGPVQGQLFILDQQSGGGLAGISAMFYDGTVLDLTEKDIKYTDITSRDIDRQDYPHYFLKEISESSRSVENTLQNRWKIADDGSYRVNLDEKVMPPELQNALLENKIRRIFFVGQGTAGVAAHACADILNYYMHDRSLIISALKSSELSGFQMAANDRNDSLCDTLIVAITQSGSTTDTNRTVDMVRERGGWTMAIVNRRDSDITFKVHGVLYTSSGRDIEMSVASTKAFYSQIVAGAVLGLHISYLKGHRDDKFVTQELHQLLQMPRHMQTVLAKKELIAASASQLAVTRTYWAAVGSGPNKASADEIRIKLSELCYKTISADYVEDKKHIDLSSEPLIIICAAGTRGTVIGDIIKDTAIFQAHKALPIVIADEGEERFTPYAQTVFHVPPVPEHLSPILNTLAGHIWGYYAALAINSGSGFLHQFREEVQQTVDAYAAEGLDVFEVILEKPFREKIARFDKEFHKKKAEKGLPAVMGLDVATDLTLLLKYLSGRLPVLDFEIDFNKKGTALNMLNSLFECLGEAINCLARPVDAIKHQAKTVTVGTSRITEKVEGLLFDTLAQNDLDISQLTASNVLVL
ncbi:MAG: SIS domain-containing protein, partial [Deltaproteobacteria bacterium]|nr:SIS domain-containing protein [Deltaproteobacteria bacterium]